MTIIFAVCKLSLMDIQNRMYHIINMTSIIYKKKTLFFNKRKLVITYLFIFIVFSTIYFIIATMVMWYIHPQNS